jgi:hypothetical protein
MSYFYSYEISAQVYANFHRSLSCGHLALAYCFSFSVYYGRLIMNFFLVQSIIDLGFDWIDFFLIFYSNRSRLSHSFPFILDIYTARSIHSLLPYTPLEVSS